LPGALEALPFLGWNEHGRLGAAPRDKLRAFAQARFKEFAEPRLGILNGPRLHDRLVA